MIEFKSFKIANLCIAYVWLIMSFAQFNTAQIASHELRRLAVSINQFGMDSIKALDRIEPPDKVLVFCPACIASSMAMIMMGSSKYQVVSSLRHGLYVWSMRPNEINKGFKDILEHIGINQYTQLGNVPSEIRSSYYRDFDNSTGLSNDEYQLHVGTSRHLRPQSVSVAPSERDQYNEESILTWERLSLPKLMKIREASEKGSWWKEATRQRLDRADRLGKGHDMSDTIINGIPVSRDASNQSTRPPDMNLTTSQMSALSNIYIQRGLTMNYNYHLMLRKYYKTVIHPVDFIRNSEETRQHINALVAANTEGKVKDLVKKDTFDARSLPLPKIMIISTFHFRGTLDIEIKSKSKKSSREVRQISTSSQDSSSSKVKNSTNQTKVFIETESTLLKFGHFSNLECSVVEIPFNNRLVSLIILIPDKSETIDLLIAKMSARILSDLIGSLTVKRLSLEIPVIKFDRGPINIAKLLDGLELNDIFYGDKAYSTETGLNRWMKPSDIVHESSIDIGTVNPKWSQTEDRLKIGAHDSRATQVNDHIKLDRPFLYFVMDSINGLILMMGRIRL